MAEPVVGGEQAPDNENGLRHEGIVAAAFDVVRYGAGWLHWVADFGPHGAAAQGVAAAVEPAEELPPVADEMEHIAALARGVVEYRDDDEVEENEEVEDEEEVPLEGDVLQACLAKFAYFMGVLRARVLLDVPAYAIFVFCFVLVLWLGITLGVLIGPGVAGAAVVVPVDTAMGWGTPTQQFRRVRSLAAQEGALFDQRLLKGTTYDKAEKVIILAVYEKGTSPKSSPHRGGSETAAAVNKLVSSAVKPNNDDSSWWFSSLRSANQTAAANKPTPSAAKPNHGDSSWWFSSFRSASQTAAPNKPIPSAVKAYRGGSSWLFTGLRAGSGVGEGTTGSQGTSLLNKSAGSNKRVDAGTTHGAAKGKKTLKDKLNVRVGSWRSNIANARNRHGRDLSRGVQFLSGV